MKKIGGKDCTVTMFADECGVSRKKISDIINKNVSGINLRTLVKICESHGIPYGEVFGYAESSRNEELDSVFSRIILTDEKDKYVLVKK